MAFSMGIAMDSSKPFGVLEILRGSINTLSKNGGLMAFVATTYVLLYSLPFLLNANSLKPLIMELSNKVIALSSLRFGTPEYTKLLIGAGKDAGFLLGVQSAYLLLYFIVSLFTKTATILISANSYSGEKLSLKDLFLKVARSWTRPFVTWFYVQLLSIGYWTLVMFPFAVLSLMLLDQLVALSAILGLVAVLVITSSLYLYVVWELALVISVIEGSYGIVAIGEAEEVVKGKRRPGFVLNLVINLLVLVPSMITIKQWPIIFGLFRVWFICLVSLFQFIAYTVYYFHCKKNPKNGSVELEYGKLLYIPVVHEDVL